MALTVEQLKTMIGKPVYSVEYNMWGILDFDDRYPDTLFFCTEKNGVHFVWDILSRKMQLFTTEQGGV